MTYGATVGASLGLAVGAIVGRSYVWSSYRCASLELRISQAVSHTAPGSVPRRCTSTFDGE